MMTQGYRQSVLIEINSRFQTGDDIDESEFFTVGTLSYKRSTFYLVFRAMAPENPRQKTTVILHAPYKVTLKMLGDSQYNMVLEHNVRTKSFIQVGEYALPVHILPSWVHWEMTSAGNGQIELAYQMESDGEILSRNTVRIKTKPNTLEEV